MARTARRARSSRAKEIGLADKDLFVVVKDGKPLAVDPYDEQTVVEGDLLVSTELGGHKVKSAMQILRDSASAHTVEQWAEIAGVSARDLVDLATEFTSHGKKAAADIHRGVSQHTNGFYNVIAWYSLNLLIGNYDYKGGMIKATAYDAAGGKEGQPFPVGKLMPGKAAPFGISLIRHDAKYEETTLFAGYPAKRPWFPLSSDIYQEIVPSSGGSRTRTRSRRSSSTWARRSTRFPAGTPTSTFSRTSRRSRCSSPATS